MLANVASGGTVDLSNYYTKLESDTAMGVAITAAIDAARDEMNAWVPTLANQYLQYYYTKIETDALLANLSPPNLTEYYTKTQIDQQFATLNTTMGNSFYLKTYIDSNYLTKLQTYTRDQVDTIYT